MKEKDSHLIQVLITRMKCEHRNLKKIYKIKMYRIETVLDEMYF